MKWKDLMQTPQGEIVGFLSHGKDRAKSQELLATVFEISKREVRKAIEYIRCNSDPDDPDTQIVASCKDGYYIADSMDEILDFYHTFHQRAVTNELASECAWKIIERDFLPLCVDLDPDTASESHADGADSPDTFSGSEESEC